jgi:hypothetical protein
MQGKEKRMMCRDMCTGQFEWQNTFAPLLGDWVVWSPHKLGWLARSPILGRCGRPNSVHLDV